MKKTRLGRRAALRQPGLAAAAAPPPGAVGGPGNAAPARATKPGGRELPLLDTVSLVAAVRGKEALARNMAAAFLRELEAQLLLLAGAHEAGDREQVVLLAHRFKGNLGLLRADRARHAAEALERSAARSGADALGPRVDRLAEELRELSSALKAWLAA